MNKKDFELLIKKYKAVQDYEKMDELLEKQIIIFYSKLLSKEEKRYSFRSRKWMLGDIRMNLCTKHAVNFNKFFELGLMELSDEQLFDELETIYEDMYRIEEEG